MAYRPAREFAHRIQTKLQNVRYRFCFGCKGGNFPKQYRLPRLSFQQAMRPEAFGDVAHKSDKHLRALVVERGDRQLDGKLLAIASEGGDLHAFSKQWPVSRFAVMT